MNGSDPYGASIEHDSPPASRSFSGLAITAFVLSIVLGIPAILGLWWAEVPAIFFGVFALGATGALKKRGRGLAIAGTVIAVVGGGLCFILHRQAATLMEATYVPVARALAANDQKALKSWVVEGDDQDAGIERSTKRMAAAQESLGKFTERLEIGNVFWGLMYMLAVPDHGEEFEPRGGAGILPFSAMWMRASFEKGDAWIALVLVAEVERDGEMKAYRSGSGRGPVVPFHEARIFRANASQK